MNATKSADQIERERDSLRVAEKRALAMAVKGKRGERRWSKLKERLLPC